MESKFSKDWVFIVDTDEYQGLIAKQLDDEGDPIIEISLVYCDTVYPKFGIPYNDAAWNKLKLEKGKPLFDVLIQQVTQRKDLIDNLT